MNLLKKTVVFVILGVIISCLIFILIFPDYFIEFDLGKKYLELDLEKKSDVLNKYRTTTLQILGGIIVSIGLYFTWRRIKALDEANKNTRDTLEITLDNQFTENFNKAIENLSNKDDVSIRLGGIYALARLAKESEKDYEPIMIILIKYLRDHIDSPQLKNNPSDNDIKSYMNDDRFEKYNPKIEIQAIINVIGERNTSLGENVILDLSNLDLSKLKFSNFNFKSVKIEYSLFLQAKFDHCYFSGDISAHFCRFDHCRIDYSTFYNVEFGVCYFNKAIFRYCSFIKVSMLSSSATDANMHYCTLDFNKQQELTLDFNTLNINNSELQNFEFRQDDISKMKFRNVTLKNVSFENVKKINLAFLAQAKSLKGVKFSKEIKSNMKEENFYEKNKKLFGNSIYRMIYNPLR